MQKHTKAAIGFSLLGFFAFEKLSDHPAIKRIHPITSKIIIKFVII